MNITRRNFLIKSLLTAAAVSMPSVVRALDPINPTPQKKVIVVGAGLAGLSSAYMLSRAGYDVTILEARNRPGGRVETLRNFADGQFADAGAYFISNTHQNTMCYIHKFGLTKAPVLPLDKSIPFFVKGKLRNVTMNDKDQWPDDFIPELTSKEKTDGLKNMLGTYVYSKLGPTELGDSAKWDPAAPGWPLPGLKKYDAMSFQDSLDSPNTTTGSKAVMNLWFGGWWGDLNKVSAAAVLRDTAIAMNTESDQCCWYTLQEGMDSLPNAFADRLSGKIRYNAPVLRISHDDEQSITATYKEAGEERQERGDYLICTIPFPVLKDMNILQDTKNFSFSPDKRNAIQRLEYASIARVFLQFNDRPWDQPPSIGVTYTDLPIMNLVDSTFAPQADSPNPPTRGILHAYLTGPNVQRLKQENDPVAFVRGQIEIVYPDLKGKYTGNGIPKFWDDDEWAKGAFAVFKKGEMIALMPHVARPEGRVYFAGDHTSSRPGWMEGALDSGHRVACEIDSSILMRI